MGVCASSPVRRRRGNGRIKSGGKGVVSESIKGASTTMVIHMDGRVEQLKKPIQAKIITSQNPNCFLCSSESMFIGTCVPRVPDEEDLQLGLIYFLLPQSEARKPLSLPDLCGLAIKASCAI
ncbi:DUF4228 domain-containing protein [Cephalotus follicularis]|uniref:DUF4228 domain-containing protein n=1 Tax=Cephalotus follicularis TaxID=3775 RepID=A0A1Q3BJX0_CEPFO|nr:DUF4228 domain-containing protein [Cephalotus follicularis]